MSQLNLIGYEGLRVTVDVRANALTIARDGEQREERWPSPLHVAQRVSSLGCTGHLSAETWALCAGLIALDS